MALQDLLKDTIFSEELDAWKLSHTEDNIYYYIENRDKIPQSMQWYKKTHITNKNLEQILSWYNTLSFKDIEKIKNRKISSNSRIATIQKETLYELKIAEDYYSNRIR